MRRIALPLLGLLALAGCSTPEPEPVRDEASFLTIVRELGGDMAEGLDDGVLIEAGDSLCDAAEAGSGSLAEASATLGDMLEAQGADVRTTEYWAATSAAAQHLCPEFN